MSSVDVPVALLGYGTVGSAVNRLLVESAGDIERATGHRLRVVRALVRDPAKERGFRPGDGVLTTDFAEIRNDLGLERVPHYSTLCYAAGRLLKKGRPPSSSSAPPRPQSIAA